MSSNSNSDHTLAPVRQAEQDLNSYQAKTGASTGSDSVNESSVNTSIENRFPGARFKYGSGASGAGDNREIPESEGGGILPSGRPTKAKDFENRGGPEDKSELERNQRGGDDDL